MAKPISFARGAPSLDIVDVDGLRAAADKAFESDPGGMTAYGTAIGYPPLREWIAERHQVGPRAGRCHEWLDAGRRLPVRCAGQVRRLGDRRAANVRPDAAVVAQPRRGRPNGRARARRDRRGCARAGARRRREAEARPHHPQLPESRRLHAVGREARAAARARAQPRVHDLRGRPVCGAAVRGRAAADDALDGRRRHSRVRVVVLQDGLPRDPRRVPGRAPRS